MQRGIQALRRMIEHGALAAAALLLCTPVAAAADDCQTLAAAMKKMIMTPHHAYSTETADYHQGQTRTSELIHTNDAIYINIGKGWQKSRMSPKDELAQEQENEKDMKDTCKYLRDESLSSEATSVYTTHKKDEDETLDTTIWVSKKTGLPVKMIIDMNVGGSQGKSHRESRFEYGNVKAPI